MKISIVIPFYNADLVLADTIRSAISAGNSEVEILAIDDGSTDSSLAIASGFEPAIRILTGPNRGVSAARNRGIAETSGDWIVFLDADDLLLAGTLQKRLEAATASAADVIVCNWQEIFGCGSATRNGGIRTPNMDMLIFDGEVACATSFWVPPAALMYRRTLIEKIGGFHYDLPILQDARLLFECAFHGAKFCHVPQIGAFYRIWDRGLSRSNPALFWRDALTNASQIEMLWRNRDVLSIGQMDALTDIYNGAAQGLFRSSEPLFWQAILALRRLNLVISWRNRTAELMSNLCGMRIALWGMILWSRLRRLVGKNRWYWRGAHRLAEVLRKSRILYGRKHGDDQHVS